MADLETLREACGQAVEIPFDAGVGGDKALGHLRGNGVGGRGRSRLDAGA
jgi:hypothetical protein